MHEVFSRYHNSIVCHLGGMSLGCAKISPNGLANVKLARRSRVWGRSYSSSVSSHAIDISVCGHAGSFETRQEWKFWYYCYYMQIFQALWTLSGQEHDFGEVYSIFHAISLNFWRTKRDEERRWIAVYVQDVKQVKFITTLPISYCSDFPPSGQRDCREAH